MLAIKITQLMALLFWCSSRVAVPIGGVSMLATSTKRAQGTREEGRLRRELPLHHGFAHTPQSLDAFLNFFLRGGPCELVFAVQRLQGHLQGKKKGPAMSVVFSILVGQLLAPPHTHTHTHGRPPEPHTNLTRCCPRGVLHSP